MTREEAINKLKILQEMGDKEIAHCNADDVICDLLKALGYEDVVKEYDVITANKISIYAMSEADKRGGWGAEAFHPNDAYSFNDNPLRAAMIVFLMMQESANVPANSTGSDLR
ncbi:phage protein NinX family protein [Enterobacter ludwigii]